MKYDREQLIRRMEGGERLSFLLFWGHTSAPGKVRKACLSQWYPAPIAVDGTVYCCNEQYMMARKALLFGDRPAYEKIMAAGDPKEIKALGREASGFEQGRWDAHKYQIVLQGNLAKFSQHTELRDFLLGTGDAVLAEASPYDGIWGIRLAAEDPAAQDPRRWRGENLLGFALMEVRDLLSGR